MIVKGKFPLKIRTMQAAIPMPMPIGTAMKSNARKTKIMSVTISPPLFTYTPDFQPNLAQGIQEHQKTGDGDAGVNNTVRNF